MIPEGETGAAESTGSSATGDGWHVQLRSFDGPLDLLLHLVRANEVEITDIPIIEITRQYNDYLDLMRELNLEIAGDYLVMAATLMHIKSRMLLPPDPQSEEEAGGEDPRAELARQLLDYQRFKQAAEGLEALEARRSLIWTREGVPPQFEGEELLAVGMFDLLAAFRKLLSRLDEEVKLELRLGRDTVSVADKISWLSDQLVERGSFELGEVLCAQPTRLDRIATFLAVLEMMRLGLVLCFQRALFDEIHVARAPTAGTVEGNA